jgi:hypothetical protein
MRLALPLLLFVLGAVGCTNTRTIQSEPLSAGTTRSFSADYRSVVDAARSAVPEAGLTLENERLTDAGTMLVAERGVTAWSWGEVVRILVQPNGEGSSVRIISDRTLGTNITAKDFTEDLFTLMGQRLGMYPDTQTSIPPDPSRSN